MVLTRSQLEKMGRDNVIEQLLNVNLSDVSAKLCDLIEFVSKYAKLHLELQLSLSVFDNFVTLALKQLICNSNSHLI